jgi:hypothetical protein
VTRKKQTRNTQKQTETTFNPKQDTSKHHRFHNYVHIPVASRGWGRSVAELSSRLLSALFGDKDTLRAHSCSKSGTRAPHVASWQVANEHGSIARAQLRPRPKGTIYSGAYEADSGAVPYAWKQAGVWRACMSKPRPVVSSMPLA